MNTVEPLLEGHMLDDVAWVAQGELHLVALHGEDAAVGAWRGVDASCEVGRVGSEPHVVDLILGRHDGQCRIENHARPEDGLIVFLARCPMVVEHLQELAVVAALLHDGLQLLHGLFIVEKRILPVPLVDDPSPGGPSPDVAGLREEIVGIDILRLLIDVETADHPDAVIVLVAVEHFFAEREERLRGHIVVFQHDALVHDAEGPFLREIFRRVAAVVLLLVSAMHLTLPVDFVIADHSPTSLNARQVAVATRAVLVEEEFRGASLPHLVEHLFQVVGAVEEQNQHRHIGLCWIFHIIDFSVQK